MNVHVSTDKRLNETLQKFWDLESIGIGLAKSSVSTTLNEAMVLKKLTIKDGRFEVSLPWK